MSEAQGAGGDDGTPTPSPAADKIKLGRFHERHAARFQIAAGSKEPTKQDERVNAGVHTQRPPEKEVSNILLSR